MKILIVEDEDSLREVMIRSLEKERYVVESAANYQDALLKINDYDYDCIVLDIMLPGGSGLSLLEELKKMRKKDSVIIVSAKDSIEDKVTGLDLGADDYLTKPFHLAELNARIKCIIRRKQQDGEMHINLANIIVYPDRHAVYINEEELVLNRKVRPALLFCHQPRPPDQQRGTGRIYLGRLYRPGRQLRLYLQPGKKPAQETKVCRGDGRNQSSLRFWL